MKVSSATLRRRISRSLVTVLALSIIPVVVAPIFTNSALAYTQGTVTSGTAYGGTGGNPNAANQNCTNGAIVAIGATKSGNDFNSFMFVCKTINNDASLSASEATTNVFGTTSESDRCAAGQIGIGVRVIASSGGSLIGGIGLICGNPMSQGNPNTRSIMPNASSAGTVFTYNCPTGQLLAGFYLRTGSLVDQITPKCSTFSAFVYAGIGSPTVTNVSTTSSTVAFTALTSNFADTALQYTVTATPISGSAITNTGSTSPIVVSSLRPNISYTFSVTASNTYGVTAAATGTAVQSTLGLPTETDTALSLNGTTQYGWVADTGTGGVFDITGAITLQAWVNPTESLANTQYTVICKSEAYQLFHFGGFWKYSLQGSTGWGLGVPTGIKVALNEWHHIAITRIANTDAVNFYYDGQLVSSGNANTAASSTIASNNLAFGIGGMVYNNPLPTLQYPFKGQIDHVAIFDVARSLADIDNDMDSYISPSTAGLRAYYDFNETSGSTLFNRTPSATVNSDLALIASPTFNDVKSVSSTSAYTTIKFPRTYITTSGGWVVPSGVSKVSAFIVGGGGGGGWNSGGGGGGGGFLIQNNITVSGTVGVQIGSGGRGGQGPDTAAPTYVPADGFPTIFNGTIVAGGNKGTIFTTVTGGPPITTDSGLSGVGGTGGATPGTPGGAGGAGFSQSNFGDTLIYSAGGGGGGYNAAGGVGGNSASSGAGNGGGSATTTGTSGLANRGGGGGASSQRVDAGSGGSGVVIVKYLVASSKPIFSGPFNDTTTAGLVETFTVTGTPNSPLVRSYQWQVSTDTGTSWATPTLGSGINSASYVTPVLTTSVSGNRYQYRVIVTDSDTAGLRMTETSSAVFLIVNPALTLTGNTTIQKAINVVKVETFTVTGGTATHRYSLTPTISGITLDTSTALAPVIRISETKTVGTYYETLTVTDSVSVSVSIGLTIIIMPPPTLLNTAEIVSDGLRLNLDAGNSASYIGADSATASNSNQWKDLSGNRKNASTGSTYDGGIACTSPQYSSQNAGQFVFNGSSNCFNTPYLGESFTAAFSVESWFKVSGTTMNQYSALITQYQTGSSQIAYMLGDFAQNKITMSIMGSSWTVCEATSTNVQGKWTHALGTFDGSVIKIYIDGGLQNTCNLVGNLNSPATYGTWIGKRWDAGNFFNGSIASARVYGRALNSTEVLQNFNATKSRFTSTKINALAPTKKYGTLLSDSFTATTGLGALTNSLTTGNRSGIFWDTSTIANRINLSLQESLTVGPYYDTATVIDSVGQSTYLPFKFTVTQADTLTISMDTPTVVTFNGSQITVFPKPVYKGLVGVDTLTVTTRFSSATYTISATRPTNADTYTVSATAPVFTVGAASNYLAVIYETSTAVVNKARQDALNPSIYGASIGSPFSLSLLGGSGDGAITETLTGVSTAPNCAISARSLSSSTTSVAYCTVTFTKASSQNYLSESITVQIFFMSYVINQPAPAVGSGPTIALSGETAIIRDPNLAPTISSLSLYTGQAGITQLVITGAGFNSPDAASTKVKFWRNKFASGFTISGDGTQITVTIPIGASTGKVLVTTPNGTAASEFDLSITP